MEVVSLEAEIWKFVQFQMEITQRLLDGFWILALQMKRKDTYDTNTVEFSQS